MSDHKLREIMNRFDGLGKKLSSGEWPFKDPFFPEKMETFRGMRPASGENTYVTAFHVLDLLRNSMIEESNFHDVVKPTIENLRQDEHALNWCFREMLKIEAVATSDLNLISMIRWMNPTQKLALLCAYFDFWNLECLTKVYQSELVPALLAVAEYCRRKECSFIEWMPSNKYFTSRSLRFSLCSSGNPGFSTVVLEASPLNTIARTLLCNHAHLMTVDEVKFLRHSLSDLPISPDQAIYTLIKMVDISKENDFRKSNIYGILDSLSLRASGGTIFWADINGLNWSSYYPTHAFFEKNLVDLESLLKSELELTDVEKHEFLRIFANIYHYAKVSSYYLKGELSIGEDTEHLIKSFPFCGAGRLMFAEKGANYIDIIDKYFSNYGELIASSIICKFIDSEYSTPIFVRNLLGILYRSAPPDEFRKFYVYAIANIGNTCLSYAHKYKNLHKRRFANWLKLFIIGEMSLIKCPWPSELEMRKSYTDLPSHCRGRVFSFISSFCYLKPSQLVKENKVISFKR